MSGVSGIRYVGLFFNPRLPSSVELARRITSYNYGGADVCFVTDEENIHYCDMDFAISIGGDGTFLRTSRSIWGLGVPLYGINAGRLGFLAAGTAESATSDICRILSGDYKIFQHIPLQGEAVRNGEVIGSVCALNDITVSKGFLSRAIDSLVSVGEDSIYRFLSDGIIVSTPTGSTAYAMSAGGPIVHPRVKCILVVPICPHSLFPRPIVLGDGETVNISIECCDYEAILSGDGHQNMTLFAGDAVSVKLDADRGIDVISIDESSYYDILRRKMNWGWNGETR
ncbi:MAG: NAD(+)/NADH kinase [Synergistaceae bacterium]|jgi:NAD+ kinase|nr:NAD(+)/NADH kinase [Synergistaceae bacterium]